MMKKYTRVITLMLIVAASSMSFVCAQANYAWIAEFDGSYANSRTFNDGATGSTIRSLTVQSTSNDDEYVIEWDSFFNKWQNGSSPINAEFTLFWGTSSSPNGVVSSGVISGNYYTFQIDGLSYSNRNAVIMETSNLPVDIVTVTNSFVAPNEDEVIAVTLSGVKSPEERVFIRYSDNGFSTSEVAELSFATTTASTGTAIIPGSYNIPGKTVSYYAYSTTVAATSSSNHDLITLRLGNNGGSNYSYTVENNWETINNGNFSTASTWRANAVPPPNQDLVIASNLSIDQNVDANSIVCEAGNDLSVNSGSRLTIATADVTPLGISGAGSLTINGTLRISAGGFTNIVPTYNAGSTLEYTDIVGSYQRFNEWTDNASLGAGGPDNVIIDNTELDLSNGSQATLVDFSINSNLTIQNNGVLTIDETESLSVGGNLNNTGLLSLNSISDDYSSLIVSGTSTGNVTYNRYVNSNASSGGNDLISAPVTGQAFNTFIGNNSNILVNPNGPEVLFGGFDTDTNNFELWDETATTPLEAGAGYRTGIATGAGSNIVTFEGTVNTANVPVTIGQGALSIWNLIGNPFTSFLSVSDFLNTNSGLLDSNSIAVYGYNDGTDLGSTGGIYTILNNFSSYNLTPGQGFFVASNATGGSVNFATSMQRASGADDFIQGRTTAVITNIKVNLSSATGNFNTDIYFSEFSSLGLDPGYDASLFGGNAPAFAIYSHLVEENMGIPFGIQALGETDYANTTIALGVNANSGEQITFSIMENSLPESVNVFLDDTVTNTSTVLNTGDYTLTPNANLNGTGRFYLRLSDSSLSTPDNSLDNLSIYSNPNDKTIVIAGQLLEATTAKIYDIQGRAVSTTILQNKSSLQTIDVNSLSTGIYIVQLVNGTQHKTQKVIIH